MQLLYLKNLKTNNMEKPKLYKACFEFTQKIILGVGIVANLS
jgi:hypothetical protein